MTAKKDLMNRIRGWFPKEPYGINSTVNTELNFDRKQPPLMIPFGYNASATKAARINAIFGIAFISLQIVFSLALGGSQISTIFAIFWVTVGFMIGAIPIIKVTLNQLNRLSRDYTFSINRKEGLMVVVPTVIFVAFTLLLYLWQQSSPLLTWISIFAWALPFLVIKFVLFYAYEKKSNMHLVQNQLGTTVFVIPKAPKNNVKTSTTTNAGGLVESIKAESCLENRIQGWFPQETKIATKAHMGETKKPNKKPLKLEHIVNSILIPILFIFLGLLNLLTENYVVSAVYFIGSAFLIAFSYFVKKYQIKLQPRKTVAVLFAAFGILCFFFNGFTVSMFAFPLTFTALFAYVPVTVTWLTTGILAATAIIILWILRKQGVILKELNLKTLSPFLASAVLIVLAYLVSVSGLMFEYAIPVTFVAIGALVLMGLRRFTITYSALTVLLVCILIFGAAVAGAYTTTYNVEETHTITREQAPNIDTVNLTVSNGDVGIWLHFTDNDTEICSIEYIWESGPIVSSRSVQYYGRYGNIIDITDNTTITPNNFNYNYSSQDSQLNITASTAITLININLNPNLKYNLNLYSLFGDLKIYIPEGYSFQSSSFISRYGTVQFYNETNNG